MIANCRAKAKANSGCEAVLPVLCCADSWVENVWSSIWSERTVDSNDDKSNDKLSKLETKVLAFGRRLIYSHHIIATSKRRAVSELASELHLGGYAKIGWPGIIMIEGAEEDCVTYVDTIRSMRWQYLTVRGEEIMDIDVGENLDDYRLFPKTFEELDGSSMSILAQKCRDVGLEELFKTSMKHYKVINEPETEDINKAIPVCEEYGALVIVDHMNDGKNYRKWLRKAGKALNCKVLVKQCYPNDNNNNRPLILVGILGEESNVRQLLKRWRTSRVDVDSKGKPCLERMLTVLLEDYVEQEVVDDESSNDSHDWNAEDTVVVTEEVLGEWLCCVGGQRWFDTWNESTS